jgi:hypothetical protein
MKLAKIGTLQALGGQDSNSENFKWGSNRLGSSARKENSRFGCFGTLQWTGENPQAFAATIRCSGINVSVGFVSSNFFNLEFLKNYYLFKF